MACMFYPLHQMACMFVHSTRWHVCSVFSTRWHVCSVHSTRWHVCSVHSTSWHHSTSMFCPLHVLSTHSTRWHVSYVHFTRWHACSVHSTRWHVCLPTSLDVMCIVSIPLDGMYVLSTQLNEDIIFSEPGSSLLYCGFFFKELFSVAMITVVVFFHIL